MTTSPTPQFEIPNEMRASAERNVEQAKLAFNNFCKRLRKLFLTWKNELRRARAARWTSARRR